MEMQTPANSRRPRKSRWQIFKEAYLPTIILVLTAIFILAYLLGATFQLRAPSANTDPSSSQSEGPSLPPAPPATVQELAQQLLAQAQAAAKDYDYARAMTILDGFTGKISDYPALADAYTQYQKAHSALVSWDASQVANLSFHLLIADPERAYPDKEYGSSYSRNFITVKEFSAILQQLYDKGYILVDMDDLYETEYDSTTGRDIYKTKSLLLPPGKTPVMLTEVNVSYYTYMVDSNGDGKPDAKGDGFAYRLCHDSRGFYNQIVNADGTASEGAYDMVPLLESFIQAHPDFSYRGARATIAFTGYDGILGYRVNSTKLTAEQRQQEKDGAVAITQALRDAGYTLACYSYNNIAYDKSQTPLAVQEDLEKWTQNVTSIIGPVDTMVFARDSDISDQTPYSDSKFTMLYLAGFRHFMGVSTSPWNQVHDLYVRHNRLMLTGANLLAYPDRFKDFFDVASILDPARG